MGCEDLGPIPIITQGSDKLLTITLISDLTKRPYDITNATAINATFLNSDGTTLVKTMTNGVTILSGAGGAFQIALTPTDTRPLAAGNGDGAQTVIVDVTVNGKLVTVIFENGVKVIARPF